LSGGSIPDDAVGAPTQLDDQAVPQRAGLDLLRDLGDGAAVGRRRQLDAPHQASTTHVHHPGVLGQCLEPGLDLCASGADVAEDVVAVDEFDGFGAAAKASWFFGMVRTPGRAGLTPHVHIALVQCLRPGVRRSGPGHIGCDAGTKKSPAIRSRAS